MILTVSSHLAKLNLNKNLKDANVKKTKGLFVILNQTSLHIFTRNLQHNKLYTWKP